MKVNNTDFLKREKELLELEKYYRDNKPFHEKVVHNLIYLYISNNRADRIEDLRKDISDDYTNLIEITTILLETQEISQEVEKTKNHVEKVKSEIEEKIEKERIRNVEILGIFGAIIAFLLSSVQIVLGTVLSNLQFFEVCFVLISVALVLLAFIVGIHLIVVERRIKLIWIALVLLGISIFVSQMFLYLIDG